MVAAARDERRTRARVQSVTLQASTAPRYRETISRISVGSAEAGGANVNAKNRFGDTPLMAAALNGHLEIVRKLRAQGADIDPRGWTPLIYAATGGHDDVVTFFDLGLHRFEYVVVGAGE